MTQEKDSKELAFQREMDLYERLALGNEGEERDYALLRAAVCAGACGDYAKHAGFLSMRRNHQESEEDRREEALELELVLWRLFGTWPGLPIPETEPEQEYRPLVFYMGMSTLDDNNQ